MIIALSIFQGRAGEHNNLAIPGAKTIAGCLGAKLCITAFSIGQPELALDSNWRVELDHAFPRSSLFLFHALRPCPRYQIY